MLARGIRNNNPGNIRLGANWEGLTDNPEEVVIPWQIKGERTKVKDSAFCMFKTCELGIRAAAKLLRNYQNAFQAKGLSTTVSNIIKKYAPANENNTKTYIEVVCRGVGVGPEEYINVFHQEIMIRLLRAIFYHENGEQPYTNEQLINGIKMAEGIKTQ